MLCYRYSTYTIQQIVADLVAQGGRMAFLSTPSLYFSLPEEVRKNCFVFDFDDQWKNDRGFVHYDFNKPDELPQELLGNFDIAIIDPPFITHEVWKKYAITGKLLVHSEGNEFNVVLYLSRIQ